MTLLTYQVFKTVTEQGSFRKSGGFAWAYAIGSQPCGIFTGGRTWFLRIKPREKRCDAYQLWRAASSLCKCSFEQR